MLQAFEAGRLTRSTYSSKPIPQRVYEAVSFINAAGETAPAYGVLRITTPSTVDGEKVINIAKPDGTYRWRYLINGPDDVGNGDPGWGTYAFDSDKILYDTGSTPAFDEWWGPKSGEWKLFQHRPGFKLDGRYNATDGVLWAQQFPPAEVRVKNGSGGDYAAGAGPSTYKLLGGAAGNTDLGLTVSAYNDMSIAFKDTKIGAVGDLCGRLNAVTWQT